MKSDFSPPLTRLDAILWFLRVQLWLSVVALLQGFLMPYGLFWGVTLQNLFSSGLPILILALFPRVVALAMLGQSAREELTSLHELRPLVGRCVGITLLVGSLGRAVMLSLAIAEAVISRGSFSLSGPTPNIFSAQILPVTLSFFLGFVLAFGPAIRDGLRAR